MRIVRAAILVLLLWRTVSAADGAVYPETTTLDFTWAVSSDTVTVRIRNSHALPVTDLFVTEHTVYTPQLLRCLVDGRSYPYLITERDTLFPGIKTTRWLISAFQSEVQLTYHVPNYFNSRLHWAAQQVAPVFGVVYDPDCCRDRRGNVDGDFSDRVDLADLAVLVAALTGNSVRVQCLDEANISGDAAGVVDLRDLSSLISYLVTGGVTLPRCPAP